MKRPRPLHAQAVGLPLLRANAVTLRDAGGAAASGAKQSGRWADRNRREAAAPGQSRWEASDRSREICSAGATRISGVTPTSMPWKPGLVAEADPPPDGFAGQQSVHAGS
jgi:hypothetical protein